MATATDTGQRIDPRLTPNRKLFAQQVSRGTGLSETVVDAWVLAEGGPDTNPLGLKVGSGFGSWSSPVAAAAAVVRTLHTNPAYAPILASATRTPEQQISAIAFSPWNGGYHAPVKVHTDYAAVIRGVYEHLKPAAGSASSSGDLPAGTIGRWVPGQGFVPVPGQTIPGANDAITGGISGAISGAESWAAGAAVIALAYLVLTVASLVLFAMGTSRLFGGTATGMARKVAGVIQPTSSKALGQGIPF